MTDSSRKKVYKDSTFDRLNKWMDAAGVQHYSFMNTFDEVSLEPRKSKVDEDRFKHIDEGYKVFALGGFVSTTLNRMGIEHYKLPHPSPRNHLFNDPGFETQVINQLKEQIRG